jgi:hypothetical protein
VLHRFKPCMYVSHRFKEWNNLVRRSGKDTRTADEICVKMAQRRRLFGDASGPALLQFLPSPPLTKPPVLSSVVR